MYSQQASLQPESAADSMVVHSMPQTARFTGAAAGDSLRPTHAKGVLPEAGDSDPRLEKVCQLPTDL